MKGGSITFKYPSDKRPDTSRDVLSLGFITPSFDAVLMRIDSHPGATNDYLQLEIVSQLSRDFFILRQPRRRNYEDLRDKMG